MIENNWSYVIEPQNFVYDVIVSLCGEEVYNKMGLNHYHHARWRKIFWCGVEPEVHVKHDVDYLIDSYAVPNYDRSLVIPEVDLKSMQDNWTGDKIEPMGIGVAHRRMLDGGARPDLGPFPRWTTRYLLSQDLRAKITMLGTAALAGSWSIHYRDVVTDLPVSIEDFPYMTLDCRYNNTRNPITGEYEAFPKLVSGTATPYTADAAHQPNFSYLPYLVTGDYYFLEELHFWANYNMIKACPGDNGRGRDAGILRAGQLREQAWSLRTLGETAFITPDDHVFKRYFIEKLDNNLTWYNNTYTYNVDSNKLGIITNGYALNRGPKILPWQDDFLTWSVGHLAEMGFSKAEDFLKWKATFSVGRMTDPEFCWILATKVPLYVRDDNTSPIYNNLGEVYRASVDPKLLGMGCASQEMADAVGEKLGSMVGYPQSPTGYPSNLQPALAVAVDSGKAGAIAAWMIFEGRSVKPSGRKSYDRYPNYAIVPRLNSSVGDVTAPETPSNLRAVASGKTEAVLDWDVSNDIGGSGLAGYKIFRDGREVATSKGNSYLDKGLKEGSRYSYVVSAYDHAGNVSDFSGVTEVTAGMTDTQAPTPPNALKAIARGASSIGLDWVASVDTGGSGLAGYVIRRDNKQVGTSVSNSYLDEGLMADTSYIYEVSAYDNAGNQSVFSVSTSATTEAMPDIEAPSVPAELTVEAKSASRVVLDWKASTDTGGSGMAGYRILRNGTQVGTSATISYSDIGLKAETVYSYQVKAYDKADNVSAVSVSVEVTTLSGGGGLNLLDDLKPGHWLEVPDSNLDQVGPVPVPLGSTGVKSVIVSWNGGAFDTKRNRLVVWGGGHTNYAGNEIYAFDVDTLKWQRLTEPSSLVGWTDGDVVYSDGRPVSRHTYNYLEYIPAPYDKFFVAGGSALYWDSGYDSNTYYFDFDTNEWETLAESIPNPRTIGSITVTDPVTNKVWFHGAGNKSYLSVFDPESQKWTKRGSARL